MLNYSVGMRHLESVPALGVGANIDCVDRVACGGSEEEFVRSRDRSCFAETQPAHES